MADQLVVVLGTLADGVSIHGPFDEYNEALAFAEDSKSDWHIMPLHAPGPADG